MCPPSLSALSILFFVPFAPQPDPPVPSKPSSEETLNQSLVPSTRRGRPPRDLDSRTLTQHMRITPELKKVKIVLTNKKPRKKILGNRRGPKPAPKRHSSHSKGDPCRNPTWSLSSSGREVVFYAGSLKAHAKSAGRIPDICPGVICQDTGVKVLCGRNVFPPARYCKVHEHTRVGYRDRPGGSWNRNFADDKTLIQPNIEQNWDKCPRLMQAQPDCLCYRSTLNAHSFRPRSLGIWIALHLVDTSP